MINDPEYDVVIIGGGLAGLAAGILLSKQGHTVAVYEKEKYPFHKVCGEYVSMESWDFLEKLGLPLSRLGLPVIDTLFLSAANGKSFTTKLPLGGFGISRFRLDADLAEIAMGAGVHLFDEVKVHDVYLNDRFEIDLITKTGKAKASAAVCCAAYGKRSNLDIKWNRDFLNSTSKKLDNHVGVKYHVKASWDNNVIGLHNFEGGYCGISKIEDDRYCLAYMTKAELLKRSNGDIEQFQKDVLFQNPWLKKIFTESSICSDFPVTISQIGFQSKRQVERGIIMMGDAAGMITPLCGNGMSIALHTAKLAAGFIHDFLDRKLSRQEMESGYALAWQKHFARRLHTGRMLQGFFGNRKWSDLFVSVFKFLPFLARPVVKMTHGKPF